MPVKEGMGYSMFRTSQWAECSPWCHWGLWLLRQEHLKDTNPAVLLAADVSGPGLQNFGCFPLTLQVTKLLCAAPGRRKHHSIFFCRCTCQSNWACRCNWISSVASWNGVWGDWKYVSFRGFIFEVANEGAVQSEWRSKGPWELPAVCELLTCWRVKFLFEMHVHRIKLFMKCLRGLLHGIVGLSISSVIHRCMFGRNTSSAVPVPGAMITVWFRRSLFQAVLIEPLWPSYCRTA